MEGHPYAGIRFERAARHSIQMSEILARGDLAAFVDMVEAEALELHALMMSSHPSYMLMRGSTVEIIHKIRDFREQSGIPLCFTLDAGPNVHLLYPHDVKEKVGDWVREELRDLCPQEKIIFDVMGEGPEKR
jgi:diphosphomevalonate decarboxylase